jgi:hypothetical protein
MLLLLLIVLLQPAAILSQDPRVIKLNGYAIDTSQEPQFDQDSIASTGSDVDEGMSSNKPRAYILHVDGAPGSIESLTDYLRENHDIELTDYLPNNAYLIEGTAELMAQIRERQEVDWIGNLRPEHKSRVASDDPEAPLHLFVSLTKTKRTRERIDAIASEIRELLTGDGRLTAPTEVVVDAVYARNSRIIAQLGTAEDRNLAESLIAGFPVVTRVERRISLSLHNMWGRGILEIGSDTAVDLFDGRSLVRSTAARTSQ